MKARVLGALVIVLATLAFGTALVVRPHDHGPTLDAYVLFLGAVGLAVVTQATSRGFPGPASYLEHALRDRTQSPPRLGELERLERTVDMATQSAFDTYYRLRPALHEIADARLAPRGVDLDAPAGASRARELLGEAAWAIVGPEATRPSDHFAPGTRLETIEAAVTALERL